MDHHTPNIDRIPKEGTDYSAEQSCSAGRSSFIMKKGKPHDVYLSQPVQVALRAPSQARSKDGKDGSDEICDFVFSTTGKTSTPLERVNASILLHRNVLYRFVCSAFGFPPLVCPGVESDVTGLLSRSLSSCLFTIVSSSRS